MSNLSSSDIDIDIDIDIIGATKTRLVKRPVLLPLLMRPAALKVELPIGSFAFCTVLG